jgi:CBS domain-containing protein
MFSLQVRDVLDRTKLLTAPPGMSVFDSAVLMRAHGSGALLVIDSERLVGILTERDIVFRVVARDLDSHITSVLEVMTPSPMTVEPDRTFGHALMQMHKNGFRHLPVMQDGRVLGLVSARNALDPDLEEFVAETARREQFGREDP